MTPQTDNAAPAPLRRHVVATVIGNTLEFYDFTAYAIFAVPIGQAFFPGHSRFETLMLSLAGFGVGFVTRPVGAVVIGRMGDRAGRRPAMVLSFTLMGLAMLALALTPPFAQIGLAAPAIVVAARLIQGFALGGEFGPAAAYLLECAPPGRRGAVGSWQSASQGLAILLAGLVGVALSAALDPADLGRWGWRAAFLLGAATLPIGLILRSSLPETLHAPEAGPAARVFAPAAHWRPLTLGFATVVSGATLTYVLTYMTTYAVSSLGLPSGVAFAGTAAGGLCGLVFCLAGGALSDRFGRKPVMLWPRIALLLAAYPAFQLIAWARDPAVFLTAIVILAALGSVCAAAGLVWLSESIPRSARSTGLAAVYTAGVTLFGATTQLAVAWLIHVTGDIRAPAYYLVAMTLVGALAALACRETAPVARAV